MWGKKAIATGRKHNITGELGTALRVTGVLYYLKSDFTTALDYFLNACGLAEKTGDSVLNARATENAGSAYRRLSRYKKSMTFFRTAINLHKKNNDKKGTARALGNLGILYIELSRYEEALSVYLESLSFFKKLKERDNIARIMNNIGVLYMDLKNPDKALHYYRGALAIYEELGLKKEISSIYNNIGLINLRYQKAPRKALDNLLRALKLGKEAKHTWTIANAMSNLGETYIRLKEYKKALHFSSEASTLFQKLGSTYDQARALVHIGTLQRFSGNYPLAVKHLKKALATAKELNSISLQTECLAALSKTYRDSGSYRAALEHFEAYYDLEGKIFTEENRKKIAEMQIKYEATKNEKEIAILKNERSLRQKEIKILKQDKKIQQLEFKEQLYLRNFFLSIILLVILLSFFVFNRYKLKKLTTQKLKQEIEEHRHTSRLLRESESKFKILAEKSRLGIFIIQDNKIKYYNPGLAKIFGSSLTELTEVDISELTSEARKRLEEENDLSESGSYGISYRHEFTASRMDGAPLFLESHDSMILFEGKQAMLCTLIDITERKRAEEELLKKRNLESIGILAGGIAHDFNNLLAVIIGHISMLKGYINHKMPIGKNLKKAEKASLQAAELAQKLVTFSEGGWMNREELNVKDLIRQTFDTFPELTESSFEVLLEDNLSPIYGDERQLAQVLANIMENAMEASPAKELIRFSAKNRTVVPDEILSLKSGEYVELSIHDNGSGIPGESMEKIFDPYFSTKRETTQQGIGMGLAICYSIIKKHAGHIAIESHANQGTTVYIYLPRNFSHAAS
ncbi:MAG: tetratricopeptide repeat protein [bacterium]|nr:tetratricopeptide repeat protein [bacterium]